MLEHLAAERHNLDMLLLEAVQANEVLAHRYALLRSAPGVGSVLALSLLSSLAELGPLSRHHVPTLAGAAILTR